MQSHNRASGSASSPRVPFPGTAALRSSIVPGWGQWAAGQRVRGPLIAVVMVLLLGAPILAAVAAAAPLLALIAPPAIAVPLTGIGAAVRPVFDPQKLARLVPDIRDWGAVGRAVVSLNVVAGLARGWVALDAAMVARRRRDAHAYSRHTAGPMAWLSGAAGLLAVLLVVAPHVAFQTAAQAAGPVLAPVLVSTPRPTNPAAAPVPVPTSESSEPPAAVWDMSSRLNVLLLGSDKRPDETDKPYGNSDTLIVVSIAEGMRSASLISIPRDTYLNIPGVGMEKINAAYREGGPALAVRVVSTLINQPIHRWASVDILAFGKIIDAVGGVVVDVEKPIRDDQFPTQDYGIRRVMLPAGLNWFDGDTALIYARSRHETNDFDRAARQQKLLLALKTRAKDPKIISRLPQLVSTLSDAVQTDASPRELLALASLGANADVGNVRSLVLTPPRYGQEVSRPDFYGVIPNVAQIRADVAQFLSGTSALGATLAAPPAEGEGPTVVGDPAAAPAQGGGP